MWGVLGEFSSPVVFDHLLLLNDTSWLFLQTLMPKFCSIPDQDQDLSPSVAQLSSDFHYFSCFPATADIVIEVDELNECNLSAATGEDK